MAKKVFTDESLQTFVDEIKSYTDDAVSTKANSSHNHAASNITSGTLSSDRLPTVPVAKGGTGATTAAAALTNLGLTATAAELNKMDGVTATTAELNYVDGVTSNIQTQLDGKAASSHTHDYLPLSGGTLTGALTMEAPNSLTLNQGSIYLNGNSNTGVSMQGAYNGAEPYIEILGTENNERVKMLGVDVDGYSISAKGITTGGTGAAYTATVNGITALTAGVSFIMIPHVVSTSTAPTLNVNSLGAKAIRRMVSNSTTSTSAGYNASWLAASKPIRVTYNGTYWIADLTKPSAADMSGTLKVANGGTGATSLTAGSYLVGNGTSAVSLKTPAEVLADIGAAPEGLVSEGYNVQTEDEFDSIIAYVFNSMGDTSTKYIWVSNYGATFNGHWTVAINRISADTGSAVGWSYGDTIRKALYAGSWFPWEWDNPSMISGVEYRTTKRHNGDTVYAQLINVGSLPNNTKSYINIGSGIDMILKCDAYCVGNGNVGISIPYYDFNGHQICCYGEGSQIVILSNYDTSALTGYVAVEYTKN